MPLKKLEPSRCLKPLSSVQSATDGWKIHAIAMNVSGIIDSSASTVANAVPKRIPRYAGMKKSRIPTIEIATVDHAMNVWIGVKPLVVFRWNRAARYPDARIIFSGATGNQPSQYAHAVIPLMCFAARGQRSLYAGYAYDG